MGQADRIKRMISKVVAGSAKGADPEAAARRRSATRALPGSKFPPEPKGPAREAWMELLDVCGGRGEDCVSALQLALIQGVGLDGHGGPGGCPLLVAARSGNILAVTALLEEGASAEVADAEGSGPLAHALAAGRFDCLERMLEFGIDPDQRDRYGDTPLMMAAASGRAREAALLIQAGADIDAANNRGRTPLHHCASGRFHLPIVKMLIEAGADVSRLDDAGNAPLDLAKLGGDVRAYLTDLAMASRESRKLDAMV